MSKLLIAALLMLCMAARADEGFDLCSVYERYASGAAVGFDHAAYTFVDMPADLRPVTDLFLNDPRADNNADGLVDAADSSMYALLYSPSRKELWIFAFKSLTVSTDSKGNHSGLHDFCMPLKVVPLE